MSVGADMRPLAAPGGGQTGPLPAPSPQQRFPLTWLQAHGRLEPTQAGAVRRPLTPVAGTSDTSPPSRGREAADQAGLLLRPVNPPPGQRWYVARGQTDDLPFPENLHVPGLSLTRPPASAHSFGPHLALGPCSHGDDRHFYPARPWGLGPRVGVHLGRGLAASRHTCPVP